MTSLTDLAARVLAPAPRGARRLIALSGPPASGKSTLAAALVAHLGPRAALVAMDGFHLDNAVLEPRGLLARKGAPETFDADGFVRLVRALSGPGEIVVPVFDRARDCAIAGASVVPASADTVVIEGNYLLFDAAPWRDLAGLWDCAIRLSPPLDTLRQRLVARWIDHGLTESQAIARADGNDMGNAARIAAAALPADITLNGVDLP